jgi:uncharacterized protein YndB with AHSA1/START domain
MTPQFRRAISPMLAVLFCFSFAEHLAAQDVKNTSYVALDTTRVLQQSLVVPSSIKEIWAALTTTEGIKTWAVPVANVDFRVGGIWESSYNRSGSIGAPGNIKNRYLSYLPMRMISFQAINAPPTFQYPEVLSEVFSVIELEELGPRSVRVTASVVGFKNNEAHDVVYKFFDNGNASTLRNLYQRFMNGPTDWNRSQLGRD